jgi:hypothetical protein
MPPASIYKPQFFQFKDPVNSTGFSKHTVMLVETAAGRKLNSTADQYSKHPKRDSIPLFHSEDSKQNSSKVLSN